MSGKVKFSSEINAAIAQLNSDKMLDQALLAEMRTWLSPEAVGGEGLNGRLDRILEMPLVLFVDFNRVRNQISEKYKQRDFTLAGVPFDYINLISTSPTSHMTSVLAKTVFGNIDDYSRSLNGWVQELQAELRK